MVHDQADELRQLARQAAVSAGWKGPAPQLVVVAGGKGGVGTTTIAVNLAVALARQGRRTVLVDADLDHPSAARLCQVSDRGSVVDILKARRTIHEVLGRGPLGLQVLAGAWAPDEVADRSAVAQQRLASGLAGLGAHAEIVVVDIGSGRDHFSRCFWQAADLLLLVTTPEPASIMESYAAIKLLRAGESNVAIQIIVNLTPSAAVAADAYARINHACRRFLRMSTTILGHLPNEACVQEAAMAELPFVAASPRCDASRALDRMAERVSAFKVAGKRGDPTARRAADGETSLNAASGPESSGDGPESICMAAHASRSLVAPSALKVRGHVDQTHD